ncbi:GNAT family N-acetyltransferase [Solibacillus sp. R5-41]|uniref:aminoglycoside 6'-N-acetyltransferase n=1 Tax=Solibacillus sp. R5-41 TaxID=2048654 RepID=UPI000C128D61|nr:aminoglycoside 6'-N-acetyltransferase [Solibacillus sp. R5-41]ATP39174.1 GNAT family N-acetyltransferase [Solibacillus sp. R5-41]
MLKKATIEDITTVAQLAMALWPDNEVVTLADEMKNIIVQPDAVIFLAFSEHEEIGFAQCQIRHDYVEGTATSPVGYLEGVYVKDAYRQKGVARELIATCEQWAKTQGCKEFASDCELHNEESLAMHIRLGFIEANRIICFTKTLI